MADQRPVCPSQYLFRWSRPSPMGRLASPCSPHDHPECGPSRHRAFDESRFLELSRALMSVARKGHLFGLYQRDRLAASCRRPFAHAHLDEIWRSGCLPDKTPEHLRAIRPHSVSGGCIAHLVSPAAMMIEHGGQRPCPNLWGREVGWYGFKSVYLQEKMFDDVAIALKHGQAFRRYRKISSRQGAP